MRVGSLFSGIGGLDLGLERAGMRVLWQVENDSYARAVLARRFPKATLHADVREVGARNLAPIDLICGGFPCVDISAAGRMAGIDADRSGLWREFARLVRELRPQYVVVENVAALLQRGMGRVVGDLAACGYDAEWDCIPARAVGAHHCRDRIFIVAYPYRERLEGTDEPRRGVYLQSTASDLWKEWNPEPKMDRVADGIPARVDRLRCLGNAVVPQVAEYIGRCILKMSAANAAQPPEEASKELK